MNHKPFGGRAPPEPAGRSQRSPDFLAEFSRWADEEGRVERRKGRNNPLLKTDLVFYGAILFTFSESPHRFLYCLLFGATGL